jgi:hypothetical protein
VLRHPAYALPEWVLPMPANPFANRQPSSSHLSVSQDRNGADGLFQRTKVMTYAVRVIGSQSSRGLAEGLGN